MSIFNELLPKLSEISNTFINNFNDDIKAVFECFDKFEEEYQNGRGRGREKAQKDKNLMTTLQSINEDEDEPTKNPEHNNNQSKSDIETIRSSLESNGDKTRRGSNKRSKNEVDGLLSPEQDKRQKRNASVKAQSIISKQVNVNLTQKMRREESDKTSDKTVSEKNQRNRKKKDDDKENSEPVSIIQIKQEKISIPPESMDMESLPLNGEVKQEVNKDDVAMPPPMAPVPRSRKVAAKEVKEKLQDDTSEEETTGRRRTTRTRKQTETATATRRNTRGSARAASPPAALARPKRTRGRNKVSNAASTDVERDAITSSQESAPASPAEKPRPKRTRRGAKAAEKEPPKPVEPTEPLISPKEERISQPTENQSSPILQNPKTKKPIKNNQKGKEDTVLTINETDIQNDLVLDKTRVITNLNSTVTIEMDKTVVIPKGVYDHAPVTPKNIHNMNNTVVLETCNRETIVLDKQQHIIMDATVVIEKDPKETMMTEDNSLLTDDEDSESDPKTPPKQQIPKVQPTSAVKEKVQQFEEMASRVTRTKTRAMAKKEEEQPETQTPPDKIVKPVLSAETLNKMNNMIFNGKAPQISSSATKPRANIVSTTKSFIPSSTSKLSALTKAKEAAEASLKREKEDAKKKKDAMLEAKRELQKRKREEKMAAAAAAREAAERERRAAMEAAAKEKMEKQAHADQGKLERMKEAERKKAELARKVAETEERRKAEEHARQQRLAEEQKRADALRRKQIEEAEAMKKEAAIMAREIEKRQKEYIEKQKMKHRSTNDKQHTPLKTAGTPCGKFALEPVHMADGFQFLNSDDEDADPPPAPPAPLWSTTKGRKHQLMVQFQISPAHVDRLFSVRVHSPDLREIFPEIDRSRLKRTSSAVWRTPPQHRLPTLQE